MFFVLLFKFICIIDISKLCIKCILFLLVLLLNNYLKFYLKSKNFVFVCRLFILVKM